MITKITGEQPFQVLTNNFSISPSNEGYTLQISADGKQFSNLFSVGAGVTRLVTGVAANSYYRLLGNQSQVSINWMKTCVTEGGGAAGNELIPQESLPATAEAGTVVALTNGGVYQYDGTNWNAVGGADMSAYWTSAQTQSAISIVEDHLYDVEQITASAYTELHDNILELSGRTVDLSPYYTSAQTEEAISAATSGKADAASVRPNIGNIFPAWNNQGIITGGRSPEFYDTYYYFNGGSRGKVLTTDAVGLPSFYAPTTPGTAGNILVSAGARQEPIWSAVTFPDVSNYVTSAQVETQILEKNYITSAATADMVTSTYVSTIWKGTQAEYDAIVDKDPNTFYIIVSN